MTAEKVNDDKLVTNVPIAGQRILVTGAAGFLGSHIVDLALKSGSIVFPTVRSPREASELVLDLDDEKTLDSAFRLARPSIVINCATYGVNPADQDLQRALSVNVHGTIRLVEAAARFNVARFVQVGSCFEYGSQDGAIRETYALRPAASYGATKAAASLLALQWARTHGLPFLLVRPFGIWGVREPSYRIVPQVIRSCINGVPLKLTHCDVLRDYCYVEDVARRILALAMMKQSTSELSVNVATGRAVVLRDFVLTIARALNGENLMQFGAIPHRPSEMKSLVADTTVMNSLLGACSEVSVLAGMTRMIEEYSTHSGTSDG